MRISFELLAIALSILVAVTDVDRAFADGSGDAPAANLASAKAARTDALEKADAALVAAFAEAIKKAAATGDLDSTKAVMAERDAFQKSKRFPQSKSMTGAMSDYLRSRDAADKELLRAYDEAVSALTKQLLIDEATKLSSERKVFAANESKRINAISGKPADNQPQPKPEVKPEKQFDTKEYLADFVSRLSNAISEIAKEPTSARRDEVHTALIGSLDAELRGNKLTFRFPIKDIQRTDRTGSSGAETYQIAVGPPEEMEGVREKWHYPNSFWQELPRNQVEKIKPGDVLIVTGKANFSALRGVINFGFGIPGAMVIITSENANYSYGVCIQDPKFAIEHKGAEAKQPEHKGAEAKQSDQERSAATRDFIKDFISRLEGRIKEVMKESTTEAKNIAHAKMMAAFDGEFRAATLTFRFPIRDIGQNRFGFGFSGSGAYRISLGPPEEMEGVKEPWHYVGSISHDLSPNEIMRTKPGDVLIVTGAGILSANPIGPFGSNSGVSGGLGGGTFGDAGTPPTQGLIIVPLETAKYEYSISVQNPMYKIEHKADRKDVAPAVDKKGSDDVGAAKPDSKNGR